MTNDMARLIVQENSRDIVLIRGHNKVRHGSIISQSTEGIDHSLPHLQGIIHLVSGHRKQVFILEMVERIGWHPLRFHHLHLWSRHHHCLHLL